MFANPLFNLLTPLTPDRHNHLKTYYARYTSPIHDLNLTNLLIWRHKHNLHSLEIHGFLFFVYYPNDHLKIHFSEPIGDSRDQEGLKRATDWLIQMCQGDIGSDSRDLASETYIPLRFRHIGGDFLHYLQSQNLSCQVIPITEDFDYCYKTQDLATLSGNRYHKKKNHLNQFKKQLADRYLINTITPENAQQALLAAKSWCTANGCGETMDLCHEYRGIKELLNTWETQQQHGLEGIYITVDQVPVAITIGEPMHSGAFLVHIEKASNEYPGLYAAINNALAVHVNGRFDVLNREQDMGIEGIRKAKQSYLPIYLVEKYDVILGTGLTTTT